MYYKMLLHIINKEGQLIKLDKNKIIASILDAVEITNEFNKDESYSLAEKVLKFIQTKYHYKPPTLDNVKDIIELVLILSNYSRTAKVYAANGHIGERGIKHMSATGKLIDNYSSSWIGEKYHQEKIGECPHEETYYLLKSLNNAKRLHESFQQFEQGKYKELKQLIL